MSPKERDPTLSAIPEDSGTKLRSSSDWNDADAEDREEQGLFEQDNTNAAVDNTDKEGGTPMNGDNSDTTNDQENSDPGPFYVQSSTGDAWELTWPIWHMLPRNERRSIASQHGYKTIGAFEEYMSLTRAVDESEGLLEGNRSGALIPSTSDIAGNSGAGAVDDDLSTGLAAVSLDPTTTNWHPPFIGQADDDDDSVSSEEDIETVVRAPGTSDGTVSIDLEDHLEMIRLGGLPCSIPDEILHKAFAYLPIDDHATLALVSPHWARFTRCESLYKTLCQRIYLNQSKRKTLHVSRFGNSYRKMLELRPRARAGGGLYVLKYQEVRKIERDMWTEIPVGAVLESVYYRYLYFFEDGRVMYALTHASPFEMIPRFIKMRLHGYGSKDKWGVWGRYQIKRDEVRVWVSHSWHDVCFQLKIIPSNKILHYDSGDRGTCTTMLLERHMSSASGNFEDDSYDRVTYEIPSHCYFRFLRDRRL